MPEYIKTNRTGHSLDDAIERSTPENAQIIKYVNGLRVEYIEWNHQTDRMYKPKIDPRYYRMEKVITRSGEEILSKELPTDKLTAGMNPFVQIIYKIVKRGGITKFQDIIRSILNEERVLPNTPGSIEIIDGIITWMNDGTTGEGSKDEPGGPYYLLAHHGKVKTGFELPQTYQLVEYKRGYDPFEYHMARLAKNYGLIERRELYEFIIEHLGWMRSPTKVDMYINKLINKRVLEKIQENYFRYNKPLEEYK